MKGPNSELKYSGHKVINIWFEGINLADAHHVFSYNNNLNVTLSYSDVKNCEAYEEYVATIPKIFEEFMNIMEASN